MKIGPAADKPAPQAVESTRTPATKPGKSAPIPEPGVDRGPEASSKVALSNAAHSLISTEQKSVSADFDSKKVERISQEISNKTYKVNAEVIADKLISNAQELLGKVSK